MLPGKRNEMANRSIELRVSEDFGRRLKDPSNASIFHFETYLPFTEAVKLERGNANVRPPKENHPFKEMIESVESSPQNFHLKNRGITYICERFQYDNQQRKLIITIPNVPKSKLDEETSPRFGIADGGHPFKVIEDVVTDIDNYKVEEDWAEPFVRVHFLASETELDMDDVVEALNTSVQVKRFTLEEYRGKFDELKAALTATRFDVSQIAFRENEDKPWQVTEIIQRLACFLKDRWKIIPPSSMYRSKDKALQLFISDNDGEFKKLFPVIKDVITFPEFIQSALSDNIEGRKLGKVKGVKKQSKQYHREGTEYLTGYRMDGAIVLPMAAAFRTLLVAKPSGYQWKVNPYDTFRACANDLYEVLLGRIRRVKSASQLAADQEYWMGCEKVVMAAKDDME
jgi:AIPR protein